MLKDGFDIHKDSIEWCQDNIESKYPNFHFKLVDVYNKHYNEKGKYVASKFKFPYNDNTFDFVSLTSVFTHMIEPDMENYLAEISRVLKHKGRCYITYFLLNSESLTSIEEKKSDFDLKYQFGNYRSVSQNDPEEAIGYDESFIRTLYQKYQLEIIEPIKYGRWYGRIQVSDYLDVIIGVKK